MHASEFPSGGLPVIKKFAIGATISNIGIPATISTAALAGIIPATTTNTTDMVGITLDTGTYATAQVAGSTPEAIVACVINSDMLIEARLSGGATAGTQLGLVAVTTAQTDGLTVVASGTNFASPDMDSGVIWGYDGVNAGQERKITTTADGTATVTVAFAGNSAVGDNYLIAATWPADALAGVTLTSDFTEVDSTAATSGTLTGLQAVELKLGDIASEGRLKSYVLLFSQDHFMNKGV